MFVQKKENNFSHLKKLDKCDTLMNTLKRNIRNRDSKKLQLSILVATRNRIQSMHRLVESIDDTAENPQVIELVFGIDHDDHKSEIAAYELSENSKTQIRVKRLTPRKELSLSKIGNELFKFSQAPVVGCFGDDVVFRTKGWDIAIIAEFEKDCGILVYGDEYLQRGQLATHFFTHRRVHNSFGYYMNEKFNRVYMDTWWDYIYRSRKRARYRPDLVFEHLHPSVYPMLEDKLFRKNAKWEALDEVTWNAPETRQALDSAITRFRWICWGILLEKIVHRIELIWQLVEKAFQYILKSFAMIK